MLKGIFDKFLGTLSLKSERHFFKFTPVTIFMGAIGTGEISSADPSELPTPRDKRVLAT